MLKLLVRLIFDKVSRKEERQNTPVFWVGKDERPGWIVIELDNVDFDIHVDGEDLIKKVKEVLKED